MGANGTGTIDFGAFPGASDAAAAVIGQAGILAGSQVEAYLYPLATADHTSDEHLVETIQVCADPSTIVPGTGFTVRAVNTSQLDEPLLQSVATQADGGVNPPLGGNTQPAAAPAVGGIGTRLYGKWSFAWVWV